MPAKPDETLAPDAPAVAAVSGPAQIGDWLVQRQLGAGAMGEVFLAQRGPLRAALKLVATRYAGEAAFTQRFQRETALLAKLNHPNVARAFDSGEHEGRPWMAMELVNGPDLEGLLNGHGPFLEADVLTMAIQIGRGLEHIHQQAGLIHRDVKPANVLVARAPGGDPNRLLNPGDLAKLIDFGLAKPTEDEGTGLTMTGMIMGTPNYISPEQVACERHLTLHVDMYALGATMFHLLTGHVPFERGSAAAVMAAHLNDAVPDPGKEVSGISLATRKVVMTALAKRPGSRHSDWEAFLNACEKALAGRGTDQYARKPPTASVIRTALEPPPGTGADALRAAVTSRIRKEATTARRRKGTHRVSNPEQASAVSKWSGRLEKAGTTGGSLVPWIAMGIAVALAITGIIWALLRS